MDYILNDIKANILEYLVKEISVRTRKLEEYNKTFNTEGIGFYLHNSVSRAYKTSYVLMVLHHTREDIAECVTLESKEKLISYFEKEIESIKGEMLRGRVVPFNTNPMVNLTSIWEHESKPEVIKFFEGCLNLVKRYKPNVIKIQDNIVKPIRDQIGEHYLGDDAMADELSKILNEKVEWEDSYIYDGISDPESEDSYAKTAVFKAFDSNMTIRITYGDVSLEIGSIEVNLD
jgi:hypothetical protein